MTESERELGRRWFEEVWNKGRREAIGEMMSADSVVHDSGVDSRGPEGFYQLFDRMTAAFSGIHFKVEDLFAEGDKLCVRWSFTAKHTGDGMGAPATGESVSTTGICILRVDGTQFVEGWQNWDMMGLTQQIKGPVVQAAYLAAH